MAAPLRSQARRPVGRRTLAVGFTVALAALLPVPAVVLGASGANAAQDGGPTAAALLAVAVGVTIAALAAGPAASRHDARTGRHR